MLKLRLITGPLLALTFLGLVWLDDRLDLVVLEGFWRTVFLDRTSLPRGIPIFLLGALVAIPFAAMELSTVARAQGIPTRPWLTILASEIGLILSYSIPWGTDTSTTIAIVCTGCVIMFVMSLITFSSNRNVQGVMAAAGAVMFAMVYLGFLLGFLLAIRRSHSAWLIVGVVLTTKACDIGAYFTGRSLGRNKLIPWLSPGKTWEGLYGGIAFAMLIGALGAAASRLLPSPEDHISIWGGALCGLIFAIVGQAGDLTMSLLKRGARLKDSSQLLPGMGGVLDVLDSPLMVAPVAYWLLEAVVMRPGSG